MIRYNELLSRHTSFCIGGPAYCWVEAENQEEILEAVSLALSKNKKIFVAGKGTNFLAKDEGVESVIIHLAGSFERIKEESGEIIRLGAGGSLAKLVQYSSDKLLGGCEFLVGIPGNAGGAIFMNAGVRSLEDPNVFIEIKDIILDVEILDLKDRKIKNLRGKDINFKYRSSGLDGKIILGARLKLEKCKKEDARDRIKAFNKKRDWITKIGFPNAGSIFKNPSLDKSAGMLIESCGLKGNRIGDAEISKVHANIIVNLGKATAKDVLSLIDLARTSVKQKFGIDLELELKVI
ncbi:MAG: UDP-N-acetylmuramate dehydrogenase [Candidatus Omnitrophica bacterium]|nr:UDP-N-acetylmuramate dehydrogenase [Candidatus Omnitrophota bacterium]